MTSNPLYSVSLVPSRISVHCWKPISMQLFCEAFPLQPAFLGPQQLFFLNGDPFWLYWVTLLLDGGALGRDSDMWTNVLLHSYPEPGAVSLGSQRVQPTHFTGEGREAQRKHPRSDSDLDSRPRDSSSSARSTPASFWRDRVYPSGPASPVGSLRYGGRDGHQRQQALSRAYPGGT